MNLSKTKKMKDPIHELASEIAAMSKVMSNDIKGKAKFCCIWVENGSKTAAAFSANIGCALKIENFVEESGDDYNECIELVAGHAGLLPIQYSNGYALVTSKNYDEFISKNGMPISEDGVWNNFEYFDWKKVLPEMAVCTSAVSNEEVFDPKLLVILEKVKDTNQFNAFHRSVTERLVGTKNHNVYVAAYPEMVLVISPIRHGAEEMVMDPSRDMKEEYKFFKD